MSDIMKIIDERERQIKKKKKNKKEKKRNKERKTQRSCASYSERVITKCFCYAFKLGFV